MKKISVNTMKKEKPSKREKYSKKEKPEKKQNNGGLLGGLFGKKQKKEDYEEEAYEEEAYEEEVDRTPKKLGGNKLGNKLGSKRLNNDRVEESVQEELSAEAFYSNEQAEEIYNREDLSQLIFMYAAPSPFVRIQKYYNNKEGITVVGTSNIATLEQEYTKKLNSKSILLFVTEEGEVEVIKSFLGRLLEVKKTNEKLFEIYMVLDKSIPMTPFKEVRGISMVNTMPVVMENGIKESMLDKIIALIVANQPAYIKEEKEIQRPTVANKQKHISVEDPLDIDMDSIRQKLQDYRKMSPEEKLSMMTNVQNDIINAKSTEDMKKIEDSIPQLRELAEVKKKISMYIEDTIAGGASVEDIEELTLTSLEVTSLQVSEMKDIINEVIRTAQRQIEIEEKKVRNFNEDLLEELEASKDNIDKMISKREEIKTKVTTKLKTYKQKVVLSANAIQICNDYYKTLTNDVKELAEKTSPELDEEGEEVVQETGALVISTINSNLKTYNVMKDDIQKHLTDTINYVSSILKDYQILVKYDDIIIDNLLEERELLMKSHIQKVIKVDNLLKEKGKLIYVSEKSDFNGALSSLVDKDMLVITSIKGIDYKNDVNVVTIDNFINEEWSPKQSPNVVEFSQKWLEKSENINVWDQLIGKINYVIKYYKRVLIILPMEVSKVVEEGFINLTVDGIVVTSADNEELLKSNSRLSNLKEMGYYSLRIIINKMGEIDFSDRMREIRTLANIGSDITETIFDSSDLDLDHLKYVIKSL